MDSTRGTPRLVITHLELENFKSYAGVQRIGPFHKSFSSVVGPNGSGKSNVIDSMLFVFGKRAKQLRLNKVSELIHNSSNFQDLQFARVSVFFQEIVDHIAPDGSTDDEKFDVIPNSQLTVSRIAYKNNSSKYLLDDKTSNYTDVTNILKEKGIDLDNNRFLILQGEVEQISMMPPKAKGPNDEGLLEYLEDIIGSNQYVEKIEEESKKLEELNDSRSGLVQRLKLTEKERDKLEDAKAEAELYLSRERELLTWRGVLCQLFLQQTAENLTSIDQTKADLNARLAHEKEKLASYNENLQEMEAKYGACQKEHDGIAAELERTSKEFKEFERKDIKYREDLKHAKQKVKKAEEKRTKAEAKLEASHKQQEEFAVDIPAAEARAVEMAAALTKEEAALEKMQEKLKGERETVRVKLEAAHAALAPLQAEVVAAQSCHDVAAAERQLLEDKHAENKARLQAAKVAKMEAEGAITSKEVQIQHMQAELKDHQKTVAKAAEVEAALVAEETALTGRVREARARVEEKRHALNSEQSTGALMKALLAAKAAGSIPGIYGRLGDLGAIDKEYDVAVSTACGPLDFVVVEDTPTAQKCVQLLRKENLGVATFLMMDQQQHLQKGLLKPSWRGGNGAAAEAAVSTPEGVPRLFDLVRTSDPRLRVAFYYALRDTLVVTDLAQAQRIAYGKDTRWARVVTLDGALIEPSGTMSGGGGRPRGGRMRVGDAAPALPGAGGGNLREALQQAEFELKEVTADLEDKRGALAKATHDAKAAAKQLAALEVALPKATMELSSLTEQVAELRTQLTALEASAAVTKEDAASLKSLTKEVEAAEKALRAAQAAAEKPAAVVADMQEKMDNLGGEPLRKLKESVSELQAGIKAAEEEAAKKAATIKTLKAGTARLEREIADAGKEKETLKEKMQALQDEFKAIEDKAMVVMEAFKETQAELASKAEELAALKAQFDKMTADTNTIRTVEVDITSKLEDLEKGEKETREQSAHWTRELKGVHTKLQEATGDAEPPALLTAEELGKHTEDDAHVQVTLLEQALADMKPDMGSIAAWAEKEEEYAARAEAVDRVTADRDEVRSRHDGLRKRRLDDFMSGFNAITLKLKEMYQMITLGGDAELELVDSLDPFSEGIVFSVRPPKKSWKNISNLSGGEKTLSSLSLVFALHHYKPTPLYVMDEIDAALDFKNVSIVAHYIKERTKNAQFVIISLRNNMFELADRLVGIYKTDNTTKSVAINPGSFVVGAAAAAAAPAIAA